MCLLDTPVAYGASFSVIFYYIPLNRHTQQICFTKVILFIYVYIYVFSITFTCMMKEAYEKIVICFTRRKSSTFTAAAL